MKVGVLVSGRGSNLEALLRAQQDGNLGAEIVVVLSDNPQAPALAKAQKHGVKAEALAPQGFKTREEYDQALVAKLRAHQVELVVLAGYMRLVTRRFLAAFPGKVINIHPSLLPAFPGLKAQEQAVRYGVKFSGCTVHFVDEGMDSGPIIAQAVVPVEPGDDGESLARRILAEEHRLLPRVVRLLAQGKIRLEGRKVIVDEE